MMLSNSEEWLESGRTVQSTASNLMSSFGREWQNLRQRMMYVGSYACDCLLLYHCYSPTDLQ